MVEFPKLVDVVTKVLFVPFIKIFSVMIFDNVSKLAEQVRLS